MNSIRIQANPARWLSVGWVCALVIGISVLVLSGWLLGLSTIQRSFPGMSAATAVGFILTGSALWRLTGAHGHTGAYVLASAAVLLGVLKYAELILGVNLGIDSLFFIPTLVDLPKLFASNTAFCMITFGTALLLFNAPLPWLKVGQLSGLAAIVVATFALIGHLYRISDLFQLPYAPAMSLSTTLLFGLLLFTWSWSQRYQGYLTLLSNPLMGSTMLRRLLPILTGILVVCGGLLLWVARREKYDPKTDMALIATGAIVAVFGLLLWNARVMDRADSERRRAEGALRESEARYRALFESSSDMILVVDEQGRYRDANPQAERLTGYTRDELVQMQSGDLTEARTTYGWGEFRKTLSQQGHAEGEFLLARKDGTTLEVEFSATMVALGLHQTIIRDISARKQVEENLRRALNEQRELNELKARFASMVSHEFRTPLSIILASTELLANYSEQMDKPQRQERLQKMLTQVTRLTQMTSELLLISKADSVGLEFQPQFVNIYDFCVELVKELQLTTKTHQIVFECSASTVEAAVDPTLMRQIVYNLVSNAVKYSPEGSTVTFALETAPKLVTLQIEDHGIGIPDEDRAWLFELFHRASNVGSVSGSGLGLAIVKRAVDAHGGSITLRSKVDEGTTFIVKLPAALNVSAQDQSAPP